jgi:hypothetical protein
VLDGRKARQCPAAFGDQDLGGVDMDAGDPAQPLDQILVRGEDGGDPVAVGDRGVERVDVREQLRDHHTDQLAELAKAGCARRSRSSRERRSPAASRSNTTRDNER